MKSKHIIAAVWMERFSGREILSGILRFAHEHPDWQLSILQLPNETPDSLWKRLEANPVDGIITSDLTHPDILRLARMTAAPIAAIWSPAQTPERPLGGPISIVSLDDFDIGAQGADYFLSLGAFNSYGFVQGIDSPNQFVCERQKGFCETIRKAGHGCCVLSDLPLCENDGGHARLVRWLTDLPKPTAIMSFYDPVAVQVVEACHELGLAVPEQVSVLGVDNDTLICESARPTISSIQPDHEAIGYQAAAVLEAIIACRKRRPKPSRLKHRLVERYSTRPISPSARLVRRALDYIDAFATRGIDVSDVVAHLGVSRRLADLRFREIEGRSIHNAIEHRRLDVAVQKLKNTKWSVRKVSEACGYASTQAFRVAFRKAFGGAPGACRTRGDEYPWEIGQAKSTRRRQACGRSHAVPCSSTEP